MNDIAVVVLDRAVPYSAAVLPVCMDIGLDSIEPDQLVTGANGSVSKNHSKRRPLIIIQLALSAIESLPFTVLGPKRRPPFKFLMRTG